MSRHKRESHSLHTDEFPADDLPVSSAETGFFQDHIQSPHLPGFFQEQPHGLFEVLQGLIFGAAARGHVELQRVSHETAFFFENVDRELNVHRVEILAAAALSAKSLFWDVEHRTWVNQ